MDKNQRNPGPKRASEEAQPEPTQVPVSHSAPERVRHRVEHTLQGRFAPPGTTTAAVEDRTKRIGAEVWRVAKRWPAAAAIVGGGVMLVAAEATGAGEVAIALGAGYALYQVLAKNVPLPKAMRQVSGLF